MERGHQFAHEQAFAPGLRMRANHGMLRRRQHLAHLQKLLRTQPGHQGFEVAVGVVMHGGQARQKRLHTVRKILVGCVHIGPYRVPGAFRHIQGIKHGATRGYRQKGRVAMPGDVGHVAAVETRVFLHEYVRSALERGHEPRLGEFAEIPGKGFMLLRGQLLIAEEQHLVFQPGGANFRQRLVVQGPGQVRTGHRRAERAGHGAYCDVLVIPHCVSPELARPRIAGTEGILPSSRAGTPSVPAVKVISVRSRVAPTRSPTALRAPNRTAYCWARRPAHDRLP